MSFSTGRNRNTGVAPSSRIYPLDLDIKSAGSWPFPVSVDPLRERYLVDIEGVPVVKWILACTAMPRNFTKLLRASRGPLLLIACPCCITKLRHRENLPL